MTKSSGKEMVAMTNPLAALAGILAITYGIGRIIRYRNRNRVLQDPKTNNFWCKDCSFESADKEAARRHVH